MTILDKERFITGLYQRLDAQEGFLNIEIDSEFYYRITIEWASERGHYFSTYFRLMFPSIMNLANYWLEQDLTQKINNHINVIINIWKEEAPLRIDDLENQPKPKNHRRFNEIDPYGEEIWD